VSKLITLGRIRPEEIREALFVARYRPREIVLSGSFSCPRLSKRL
jgi:hypothetical protein